MCSHQETFSENKPPASLPSRIIIIKYEKLYFKCVRQWWSIVDGSLLWMKLSPAVELSSCRWWSTAEAPEGFPSAHWVLTICSKQQRLNAEPGNLHMLGGRLYDRHSAIAALFRFSTTSPVSSRLKTTGVRHESFCAQSGQACKC